VKTELQIILLRNCLTLNNQAAKWFHEKWKVPVSAYLESIEMCQMQKNDIPQWYLLMENNKIIAGLGVIENDFHKRRDLTPNICAVFVEKEYRRQGIAKYMLDFVCKDLKNMGYKNVYLITNHTEFYEKCGWSFLEMIEENDGNMARMYTKKIADN